MPDLIARRVVLMVGLSLLVSCGSDPQADSLDGASDRTPPPYGGRPEPGEWIAFASARDASRSNIYVMAVNGDGPWLLTDHAFSDTQPAWSPASTLVDTRIAFASERPDGKAATNLWASGGSSIWVMAANGSRHKRLTDNPGFGIKAGSDRDPAWSPDGRTIAYSSDWEGHPALFRMAAAGASQKRLSKRPNSDVSPSWSPNGERIVSQYDTNVPRGFGSWDIVVMDTDGTSGGRLTHDTVDDYRHDKSPTWSPDGRSIAFVSRRYDAEGSDLYLVDADGTNERNLTRDAAGYHDPAWSPDGSRIAFWSSRSGNAEIYIMKADGSDQRNITNHPGWDTDPAWSW